VIKLNYIGTAVITFLIASAALAQSQITADRVWVKYNLSSMYRGMDSRIDEVKQLLNRELGLYSAKSLEYAHQELDGYCVPVFQKVEQTHSVDSSNQADYERCRLDRNMVKPSQYPRELMLKALDALKELDNRGYVLVADGSMSGENDYWGRTGVMSKATFVQIASGGLGDNLVGIGEAKYTFNGTEYKVHHDLVTAMNFLDFTDSYNPSTRQWSKKYQTGSLEETIVQKTNSLIATYESVDDHFQYGADIRQVITKNFDSIVQEARTRNAGEAKSFAEQRVKETTDALIAKYNKKN
jgi:hypothetical protein